MLELPVVASNVGPYRESTLATLTSNDPRSWAEAIAHTFHRYDDALGGARNARETVLRDRMLKPSSLEAWLSVVLGRQPEGRGEERPAELGWPNAAPERPEDASLLGRGLSLVP